MSTPEQHNGEPVEQRSSVKLTLNAKGEVQIDVKVVAGETDADVEAAREKAVAVFNALRQEYPRA